MLQPNMSAAARLKTSHVQVGTWQFILWTVVYHLLTSLRSCAVDVILISYAAFQPSQAEISPHQQTPRQTAVQINMWLVTFMLAGAAALANTVTELFCFRSVFA